MGEGIAEGESMTDKIAKVYKVKTGTGESMGLHFAVAYCDAPTFTLEPMYGNHAINWREDLCELATPEEEVDYWKARAFHAESKLSKP